MGGSDKMSGLNNKDNKNTVGLDESGRAIKI